MENENEFDYSTNIDMSYKSLRESLIRTGRWMEYSDIAKIKNIIFKELDEDENFTIEKINNRDIITNKTSNERIVFLDPRLHNTEDSNADADKIERVSAINDLLDLGGDIGGEITFAQPISTNQEHWTLVCFKINLDNAKEIRQNKRENLSTDDLNELAQNSRYEVDSLKDDRQNDGHSCGVHAMDAFLELCEHGFDGYKEIYEERCRAKTNGNNRRKGQTKNTKNDINNSKWFTDYDIKNTKQVRELAEKKEVLAKTLGLDDRTKKFLIRSGFYDKDTIESIQGIINETKNPNERQELINDIKGNISAAMKEVDKEFNKNKTKDIRNFGI